MSRTPKKYESPLQRLQRQREEQSTENMLKGAVYNMHLTEAEGSDPVIIGKIAEAMEKNLPFGLKCQRSSVIFIPGKLKAYWVWGDGEAGPVFNYDTRLDFDNSVKFQYLGHKEFITTSELAAMAKIIFYQHALDNLESWRPKVLPESGKQTGPLETGTGGV